jgi:flotillin
VQARVEVEQRRSEQATAALQADVIAPAEAQRQADVARAEGQRQAAILGAQAAAEAARQAGQAEADARKAAADALRVERQAEADGIKAKLVAEAAGKKEIAAALNTYSPEAARLQTLPDVLASVVKATEAAAMPLAEIDRLTIIGGAGDTQDAVGGLLGVSPLAVAKIVEALKSSGIDLAAMLNRGGDDHAPVESVAVPTNSHPVAPPTS